MESQSTASNIFMIADYHSITNRASENPDIAQHMLRTSTYDTAAMLLACGINPSKSIVFRQSDNADHTELQWLLSGITPLSWLNRMTQFKTKKMDKNYFISAGLYTYPILMAADILLYKYALFSRTTIVPVGVDQKQHVEMAQNLARRINMISKADILPIPEYSEGKTPKIYALNKADAKMSKSCSSKWACLYLEDTDEIIQIKIERAKTDSEGVLSYNSKRPEIMNLINIYCQAKGLSTNEAMAVISKDNMGDFKRRLYKELIRM